MTKLHYVKKARKSNKKRKVKKGLPYYWWSFGPRFGRQYSLTKPRRSAYMTTSPFLKTMMDLEDDFMLLVGGEPEDVKSTLEVMAGEVEALKEETEQSLASVQDRFPNGSPTVELLEQRVEFCEAICNQIADASEAIDTEPSQEKVEEALNFISWEYS